MYSDSISMSHSISDSFDGHSGGYYYYDDGNNGSVGVSVGARDSVDIDSKSYSNSISDSKKNRAAPSDVEPHTTEHTVGHNLIMYGPPPDTAVIMDTVKMNAIVENDTNGAEELPESVLSVLSSPLSRLIGHLHHNTMPNT
eukprot:873577_1